MFLEEFQALFFKHLDKVITQNTISLEVEKALLRQIIRHTEEELAYLPVSDTVIAQYHWQFLTINNIQNHDIHPTLLQRLPSSHATSLPQASPKEKVSETTTKRFSRKIPNASIRKRKNCKRFKPGPTPTTTNSTSMLQTSPKPQTSIPPPPQRLSQQHFLDQGPVTQQPT